MSSLKNSLNLTKAAREHVADVGEKGLSTQIGSDGSRPNERMERFTAIDSLWSENMILGGYKSKEIVEYMLVADGDKRRGLRNNIFNPKLKLMGVAVAPHSKAGSVTVVDFVNRELATGELPTIEIEEADEIPEEMKEYIKKKSLQGKVKVIPSPQPKMEFKRQETVTYGTEALKPRLVSIKKLLYRVKQDQQQVLLVSDQLQRNL